MALKHKIAVIGERKTGKTFFCQKIAHLAPSEEYVPTVGAKQYEKIIPRQDNIPRFTLDINDVSEDGSPLLIPRHVRQADTVLLFFDPHNPETLEDLQKKYLDKKDMFPEEKREEQQYILVANKQQDTPSSVQHDQILALQSSYDLFYIEINAKSESGLNELQTMICNFARNQFLKTPDIRCAIEAENKRLHLATQKYQHLWDDAKPVLSIKRILDDYAMGGSTLSLLWHCHLNRHHVKEISGIVQSIDEKNTDHREILRQVNAINKSATGSLALRMAFINEKLNYAASVSEISEGNTPYNGCCF